MEVQVQSPGNKSTLSISQMLLLNAIVCGLEFCASAAFCYIPPMLLKAGVGEERMSMVLGIGPLLGFFLVPIIGRSSDKCRSRYGRRRPFIFGLSLLLLVSLVIIPFGDMFGVYLLGGLFTKAAHVQLLVIGAVTLDFASQTCLTPCEALLSDASRNTDQHHRCFMVYSFMVSLGGCIGYLITALDWSGSSVGLFFGSQEKSVFALLIVLFSFSMLATLGVAQEAPYAPEQLLDDTTHADEVTSSKIHQKLDQLLMQQKDGSNGGLVPGPNDPGYESASSEDSSVERGNVPSGGGGGDSVGLDVDSRCLFTERNCNIPLTRLTVTSCSSLVYLCYLRVYHFLPDTLQKMLRVPFVLRRLALANFCSWTAVMAFNLFFTDFVGQAVYGGNPNAEDDSPEQHLYDQGVRMGSWGLLFHCITAALYAPCVEKIVECYGTRICYFIGMFSFTLAMSVMVFSRNVYLVTLMAACTGFAYATVTTVPFMLVTLYHDHKEIFFYDARTVSGRGIGTDIATLDSAYFLSQVILSALMGYLVHLSGTVLAYIVCAGGVGAVACACVTRIVYSKMHMQTLIKNGSV